jgi:hypothetical protein
VSAEEAKPNTSAEVVLPFGGQRRKFALKIKQIDELQRLCGAGIGEIVERAFTRKPYIRDIYDTIRLGLVGGGMDEVEAMLLCDTYIDGKALNELENNASAAKTAKAILGAVYFGLDELKAVGDENADSNKKKDASPAVPAG